MFYRKFILSVIVFLAGIFCLNQLEIFRWLIFDPGYGMMMAKTRLIEKSYGSRKVVLLGDSRLVQGYRPSTSSNKVINLAISGSTPISAYFILKRLLNHSTAIEKLIISFTPGNYENNGEFYTDLTQFYNYDEINTIAKGAIDDDIFGKSKLFVLSCQLRSPMCFQPYYSMFLKEPLGFIRSRIIYKQVIENLGWRLQAGQNPEGLPDEMNNLQKIFQPIPLIDEYFKKIIQLSKENNIKIIFYVNPLSDIHEGIMSRSNYMNEFYRYICESSPEIILIRGGSVPRNYLVDGSHLNAIGAQYVTKFIDKNIIENKNLLSNNNCRHINQTISYNLNTE